MVPRQRSRATALRSEDRLAFIFIIEEST